MFDFITKHSVIWLSLYLCGSVLMITAVGSQFGGQAAGTLAGFLVLAGTIGYEILSRYNSEKKIKTQVSHFSINHDRLTRELARTRGEVDSLKDDMTRTANLLKKQDFQKKNAPEPKIGESLTARIQQSLEKMGSKPRATVNDTSRRYEELSVAAALGNHAGDDTIEMRPSMRNPSNYSDTIVSELLHHAVHNDRIEIFAQPIVKLPSRKLVYLELFGRIRARPGVYLPADRYRDLAEEAGSIADVDHLLLIHVLDSVRADIRRGVEIGYFLNVATSSFKDSAFMADLIEFLKRNRDASSRLIFEIRQEEFNNLTPQLMAIVQGLSQTGCQFSIDNIENPNLDIVKLQKLKIEFIKIDAAKLISLVETPEGESMVSRLKTRLDSVNITLIVEKMETEHDVKELLDFDIEYGEGFLFGKPDLEVAYRPKKSA